MERYIKRQPSSGVKESYGSAALATRRFVRIVISNGLLKIVIRYFLFFWPATILEQYYSTPFPEKFKRKCTGTPAHLALLPPTHPTP